MIVKDDIQEIALGIVTHLDRAGVAISMGVGKTLIGLKHMRNQYTDYSKFLIVAPKRSVFQTWKDEAYKFGYNYLLEHMHFTTYLSLSKQDLDYDCIYLDECHNLLYSHKPWLSTYKNKILGLTGTPPRIEKSEKGHMVNTYCPIAYKYKIDNAVSDKILNDYKIILHPMSLDESDTVKVEKNGKTWYTSETATYTYWSNRILRATSKKESQICSIMRMKSMMSFPSKENYAYDLFNEIKDKAILFANTQDQADRLCTHSYHANNLRSAENLNEFKSGKITKLSAVLQLNEGVNIPNLKEGIVMHSYSGSSAKSPQRFGRLLRLNPDDRCTLHILYYRNTVDEQWVSSVVETLDQSKITIKNASYNTTH